MSTSGNVEAFVEEVDREQDVDVAVAQRGQCVAAIGRGGLGGHGQRGDTGFDETLSHVAGVLDADAESQGAHGRNVGHLVVKLLEHDAGAGVVAGVDVAQRCQVVAATSPLHGLEVGSVVDAEVVERAQQVLLECFPQPQLGGDPAAEELADVDTVGAFRSGGQPDQLDRLHVVEQPSVRRGLGVMELVDHHDVEVIWFDAGKPCLRKGLDAGEHVPPLGGFLSIHQQLAERRRR